MPALLLPLLSAWQSVSERVPAWESTLAWAQASSLATLLAYAWVSVWKSGYGSVMVWALLLVSAMVLAPERAYVLVSSSACV